MIKSIKNLTIIAATFLAVSCATSKKEDPLPTDARDVLVGTWHCSETSKAAAQTTSFDTGFDKLVGAADKVTITSFYNALTVQAVYLNGSFEIKDYNAGSGKIINGIGTLVNNGKMTWRYYVKTGTQSIDTCDAIFTR